MRRNRGLVVPPRGALTHSPAPFPCPWQLSWPCPVSTLRGRWCPRTSSSSTVLPCQAADHDLPAGCASPRSNSWGPTPPLNDSSGDPLGRPASRVAVSIRRCSARTSLHVLGSAPEKSEPCPLHRLRKRKCLLGRGPTSALSPARCSGSFNPAKRTGHGRRRMRPAHSAPAAARVPTRGRGSKREEGPQASSRVRQPDSVRGSPQVRGRGSAAPFAGPLFGACAPTRDGPGWRDFQGFYAGPSGASYLSVRHVLDHGHAPI
ncbi:hypothetical protein NDU88_005632 [Pleurodeles waltl]|uniref:Uncharacterized protein n=1 Tax=Pleurodeles waltl TaxID=8319 RepID=A0AAV7MJZ1_PLEWA|nr:hypothetical protein NDU88_005632 [Pleurodeles waltl]